MIYNVLVLLIKPVDFSHNIAAVKHAHSCTAVFISSDID